MKITGIRVHVLRSPLEEPFAFSQGWVRSRNATIVEIETDDGIVGWGEAFTQGLEPPQVSAAVIEHALAPGCYAAIFLPGTKRISKRLFRAEAIRCNMERECPS